MTSFRLNLLFTEIDFDDDRVFEALGELSEIVWRAQGRLAHATVVVSASTALEAAKLVIREVVEAVPGAVPLRLDPDLVAIPDVASRLGVSREAVRNWANGTRHSGFPFPKGVVGDGIKIWAWSDVNRWLRRNLGIGDPEEFPDERDTVAINGFLAEAARCRAVAAEASATWSDSQPVRSSTPTRTVAPTGRSTYWRTSSHHSGADVTSGKCFVAA